MNREIRHKSYIAVFKRLICQRSFNDGHPNPERTKHNLGVKEILINQFLLIKVLSNVLENTESS